MHFKSALIVCAVCFLTSAYVRSIGLNSDQLKRLNELLKDHNNFTNGINEKDIVHIVEKTFVMEWDKINFKYNSKYLYSKNLRCLLNVLAKTNKSSDKPEVKTLQPFEVKFYLNEMTAHFKSHKQPGFLTLQQLPEVFSYWRTINKSLNQKSKDLETEKGEDYVIYSVDFLLIMLEIKPTGCGLTQAQIEKFGILYETHKTSGSIDPKESEKVFKELGITVNDELKLLFKSDRCPGKMLMDLIMAAAERNEVFQKNGLRVYSPSEVAFVINEFEEFDVGNNGALPTEKYAGFDHQFNHISRSKKLTEGTMEEAQHFILDKFDGIKTTSFVDFMETIMFFEKNNIVYDSDDSQS